MDWRVLFLSGIALLITLSGLMVLALPDTYEGEVLYTIDPTHAIRVLDVVGAGLMAIGGLAAWGAGMVWQQNVTP